MTISIKALLNKSDDKKNIVQIQSINEFDIQHYLEVLTKYSVFNHRMMKILYGNTYITDLIIKMLFQLLNPGHLKEDFKLVDC